MVNTDLELPPGTEVRPIDYQANQKYFYSPSEKGFFVEATRNSNVPEDAVEIDEPYYDELLEGQRNGLSIFPDEDGLPILTKKYAEPTVLIEDMKRKCSAYRKFIMSSPVTLHGVTIRPESDEQTHLTSTLTGAQFTGQESFDFKFQNEWVTLSKADLQKVVTALHKYVQAMYTTLRMHHDSLDAFSELSYKDADPIVEYDVTVGWPEFDEFVV